MENHLLVKIKRLSSKAVIPSYAKAGDAGMDLTATSMSPSYDYGFIEYGTDLAVAIPEGYVGLVYPRSSISKTSHILCNSVAVVDAGYTGEIRLRFRTDEENSDREYMVGDRVGQLVIMPYPKVKFEEVENLVDSERGSGGFGSSGR